MATSTTVMDGVVCCKRMLPIHLPQTDYLSQLFHDNNPLLKDHFSNYTFESLILLTRPKREFWGQLEAVWLCDSSGVEWMLFLLQMQLQKRVRPQVLTASSCASSRPSESVNPICQLLLHSNSALPCQAITKGSFCSRATCPSQRFAGTSKPLQSLA